MFKLRRETAGAWIERVIDDLDPFLVDHAACERKAAATAMAFVVRYPDRVALIEPMIELAREELEHFRLVCRIIHERDLTLGADEKDPYVNALLREVRVGRDERLLDRLLIAGVVEARGCERFGLVGRALPAGELKTFYQELERSEARHHGLFWRLAHEYFDADTIEARLDELLDVEARIIDELPLRSALH